MSLINTNGEVNQVQSMLSGIAIVTLQLLNIRGDKDALLLGGGDDGSIIFWDLKSVEFSSYLSVET